MSRHRNLILQKFVAPIPKSLLREYFTAKMGKDPFLQPDGDNYDIINTFFDENIDENFRNCIFDDFRRINDLCDRGMSLLINAALRFNILTQPDISREELAMDLYLHNSDAFNYAYDNYCFLNSSSKMSQYNITAKDFSIDDQKMEEFKEKISAFYSNLAKGSECIVRHYDDNDKVFIVVIRGSYQRSMVVWKGEQTDTLFFRPAHEDILQFDKKTSVLTIKAPYDKDKENYIATFSKCILGDEDQTERADRDNTYALAPLENGTFNFSGNEQIRSISLSEVKLVLRGETNPTITINSSDVLGSLQKDLPGLALSSGYITHAKFVFHLYINKHKKRVSFEVTPPNVTDLNKSEYAEIIAKYLKKQGVKLI